MKRTFSSELFQALPIVGILRGVPAEKLPPLLEAAREGGLTNVEITMNTPGAAAQIRAACDLLGSRVNVGAGTVTSVALLESALEAGAGFIVTPTLAMPVIERCLRLGLPVFPGAFSPSEIFRAWEMGATMVKVFPADSQGPSYLRSLKAALPSLRLMPTGGVDLSTVQSYRTAGADAFGIGSPLFRPDRILASDWPWIRTQCELFTQALHP